MTAFAARPPFPGPDPRRPDRPDRPGYPPGRPDRPWPFPAPAQPPETGFRQPPTSMTLELEDRLLQRRIVMLHGPLDHDAATRAAARLMLLDADSGDGVQLQLSCSDGDLPAALMLADTLDLMRSPVTATALGVIGGPPLGVFAAADRRLAHPHSRFVLRQPHATASGRADELAAAAEQHAQLLDDLCARIAAVTPHTAEQVAADLREGRVLDAAGAMAYGLVEDLARV